MNTLLDWLRGSHEHVRGLILGAFAALEGFGGWFLVHVQAIDSLMQFAVYAVALATGLIGLRKVLRSN